MLESEGLLCHQPCRFREVLPACFAIASHVLERSMAAARMVSSASAELESQEWYQPAVLIQEGPESCKGFCRRCQQRCDCKGSHCCQEGLLGVEGSNRIAKMASIDFPESSSEQFQAPLGLAVFLKRGETALGAGWPRRYRFCNVETCRGSSWLQWPAKAFTTLPAGVFCLCQAIGPFQDELGFRCCGRSVGFLHQDSSQESSCCSGRASLSGLTSGERPGSRRSGADRSRSQ